MSASFYSNVQISESNLSGSESTRSSHPLGNVIDGDLGTRWATDVSFPDDLALGTITRSTSNMGFVKDFQATQNAKKGSLLMEDQVFVAFLLTLFWPLLLRPFFLPIQGFASWLMIDLPEPTLLAGVAIDFGHKSKKHSNSQSFTMLVFGDYQVGWV